MPWWCHSQVNGMSAVMDDWSPLVEGLAKKRKGE